MPKPSQPNSTGSSKPVDDQFISTTARRRGQCAECMGEIFPDDHIVWDKHNHKTYCHSCGQDLD
jgi:hypothetical protein